MIGNIKEFIYKNLTPLFGGYTTLVFLLCVLPINGTDSTINNIYIVNIRLDYIFHIIIFIPWMLLWSKFSSQYFQKTFDRTILIFVIGVLFAFSLELVQYFLPFRAFNTNDMIANISGIGVGAIIAILMNKLFTTSR